jgi:hypothetical protein
MGEAKLHLPPLLDSVLALKLVGQIVPTGHLIFVPFFPSSMHKGGK